MVATRTIAALVACTIAALLAMAPHSASAETSQGPSKDELASYAISAKYTTSLATDYARDASKDSLAAKYKDAAETWSSAAYFYKRAMFYYTMLGDFKAVARRDASRINAFKQICKSNCDAKDMSAAPAKASASTGKNGGSGNAKQYAKNAKLATSLASKAASAASKFTSAGKYEEAAKSWSTAAYHYEQAIEWNTLLKDSKNKTRSRTANNNAVKQACKSRCEKEGEENAAAQLAEESWTKKG